MHHQKTLIQTHTTKKMPVFAHTVGAVAIIRWVKRPFVQHLLLLLASALLALSFGSWFLGSSHTSFAKSTSFETCATVPAQDKPMFCTGTDPVVGGCSLDAQSFGPPHPIMLNGTVVGRAEIRYSALCNTYWGRGFTYLTGTSIAIFVANLGTSDAATYLSPTSEVYSNMVYATVPTITVQIPLTRTQIASTTFTGTP